MISDKVSQAIAESKEPRETQVQKQFIILQSSLSELDQVIAELRKKLSPVLREALAEEKGKNNETELLVPLANELRNCNYRILQQRREIIEILDILEL